MNTERRWSARELKEELDEYERELRDAGKARNTINTYVQHPERFIKWLERRPRPSQADPNLQAGSSAEGNDRVSDEGPVVQRFRAVAQYQPTPKFAQAGASLKTGVPDSEDDRGDWVFERASGRSSRYDPLRTYLAGRGEPVIRLSFGEIERILGVRLPDSARRHRAWWSNSQEGTHVHARSWLEAGRRTRNVDLNGATAEFVR